MNFFRDADLNRAFQWLTFMLAVCIVFLLVALGTSVVARSIISTYMLGEEWQAIRAERTLERAAEVCTLRRIGDE